MKIELKKLKTSSQKSEEIDWNEINFDLSNVTNISDFIISINRSIHFTRRIEKIKKILNEI